MTKILTTSRPSAAAAPVSWTIDHDASSVGFRVRHFGVATVAGTFSEFDGRLDGSGIVGTVAPASVSSGNAIRDRRLASREFFDAERFPSITFSSTATELTGIVSGELTIRDVTQPVTLKVSTTPIGGEAVSVRARGRISRAAFDLQWSALVDAGRLVVSDHVDVVLDLVLVPAEA